MRADMRVVEADIVALDRAARQPRARLQEELVDGDVRRHAVLTQRLHIQRLGIAREQPVEHRFGKASLKVVAEARPRQRQPGEDRQFDTSVVLGKAVQRIQQVNWLAYADRYSQADVVADPVNDDLGATCCILQAECIHGRTFPRSIGLCGNARAGVRAFFHRWVQALTDTTLKSGSVRALRRQVLHGCACILNPLRTH